MEKEYSEHLMPQIRTKTTEYTHNRTWARVINTANAVAIHAIGGFVREIIPVVARIRAIVDKISSIANKMTLILCVTRVILYKISEISNKIGPHMHAIGVLTLRYEDRSDFARHQANGVRWLDGKGMRLASSPAVREIFVRLNAPYN